MSTGTMEPVEKPAAARPPARRKPSWREIVYLLGFYVLYATVRLQRPAPAPAPSAPVLARRRLPVWREAVYLLAMYLVYSTVRNRFGSAGGEPGHANGIAFGHALDVIGIERWLHSYFEEAVQAWYLDLPGHGWIQAWNVFYGTAHFIVTAGTLVWVFLRAPGRYSRLRNTLTFSTLLALIGFASFSLMPPRLLDEPPERFGPPTAQVTEDFAYVDTLATYPTFWSFDSGGLKSISNQYAAMPSLHIAWSTWSATALWPLVRRRWLRALVALHPLATFFCIIVTANHYWLDAAAGLLTLAGGYLVAARLAAWHRARGRRGVVAAA
ncbi:MAG: phosphatase PAP2 family protein [Acidimicrobiia bacterium]